MAQVTSGEKSYSDPTRLPKIELRRLSAGTVYLRVPSFGLGIREQLERAIEVNQARIRNARTLIIDVRKNRGGSDSSFSPLLGLLKPATYAPPSRTSWSRWDLVGMERGLEIHSGVGRGSPAPES